MKHIISVAVVVAFAIGMIARPVKASPTLPSKAGLNADVVKFAKDEVQAKKEDKPKKTKKDDKGKGNDDKDDKGNDDKGKDDDKKD